MKKIMIVFVIFSSVFLFSCQVNRVFDLQTLEASAYQEFNFDVVYTTKAVDTETAIYLTGERYLNACVIIGQKNGINQMLFFPRKVADPIILIDYPFNSSLPQILAMLVALEDNQGNSLYYDPAMDYGNLAVNISSMIEIQNANPTLIFDSQIVFEFITDGANFYVASVDGLCKIFGNEFQLLG